MAANQNMFSQQNFHSEKLNAELCVIRGLWVIRALVIVYIDESLGHTQGVINSFLEGHYCCCCWLGLCYHEFASWETDVGEAQQYELWVRGGNLIMFYLSALLNGKCVTRWTICQKECPCASERMGMNISRSHRALCKMLYPHTLFQMILLPSGESRPSDSLRRPFVCPPAENTARHRTHSNWRVWGWTGVRAQPGVHLTSPLSTA